MSRQGYKAVKVGWKMSEEQASWFWRNWERACRVQGWTGAARDVKRHEVLAGLGFASIKEVDKTAGFDRLKKRVLELQAKVLVDTPETGQPAAPGEDAGERRRLLWRVAEAVAALQKSGYPEHSFATVFRDFGLVKGWRGIADLEQGRLLTLSRTLSRIHTEWLERKAEEAEYEAAKPVVDVEFSCDVPSTEPVYQGSADEEEPF